MLVTNFGFRDLDKKWVLIENKKQIKKLVKKLKIAKTKDPLIAYFFVDQEDGFCMKVIGNVFRDEKNNLFLEDDYIYENKHINYSEILKFDVSILDNKITNYIKGVKSVEGSSGLIPGDQLKLRETRVMTNIDQFRNDAYPDDVEIILPSKDGEIELLWAHIEGVMRDDVLICKLLQGSEISPETHPEGTMVGVKFVRELVIDENDEEVEEDCLKVIGILKPKNTQ